jgi:hypothetical protein
MRVEVLGKVAALRYRQGDFSGLPTGDPVNGCIFRHIRHNWPLAIRKSHENLDGEGHQVRLIDLARAEPMAAKAKERRHECVRGQLRLRGVDYV